MGDYNGETCEGCFAELDNEVCSCGTGLNDQQAAKIAQLEAEVERLQSDLITTDMELCEYHEQTESLEKDRDHWKAKAERYAEEILNCDDFVVEQIGLDISYQCNFCLVEWLSGEIGRHKPDCIKAEVEEQAK